MIPREFDKSIKHYSSLPYVCCFENKITNPIESIVIIPPIMKDIAPCDVNIIVKNTGPIILPKLSNE